ncbi:MAG: substrate-binding domain-containing protein [Lachnospiraceae bacterium]|nr:substrate-binding domain-containing protein [Lachnospiraceae bacterium]
MRIGSRLTNEPNKRKDGFVSVCEARNIPYTLKITEDGMPYSAFEEFLQAHMSEGGFAFDGIFCITDSLAHQITNSLRKMGLRVPEDVQLIGFDGCRHFGDMEYCCSTIVQPLADIAETCVDLVLREQSSKIPSLICLPVSYAYGGTTRS